MIQLTQRIADVAFRWTLTSIIELMKYKKAREIYDQVDLDTLENHVEFSTLYYCSTKYINSDTIEFIFGYRMKDKPEYFKKILCELIFKEIEFNPDIIKDKLNGLVDNVNICKHCDHGNLAVAEYDMSCKQCYIFGTVNEEDSCAICLLNDFGVWLVTPCHHKFHYRCFNKMPEKLCPLCRTYTGNNTTILDY